MLKQLFKFAVVGVTSFVVDMSVYYILTRTSSFFLNYYLLANTISFLISAAWSFGFNKIWTFRHAPNPRVFQQSIKFLLVSTGGLLLTTFLLRIAVENLRMYDILAKFLIAIIVMFWNFFVNKYWTFKKV